MNENVGETQRADIIDGGEGKGGKVLVPTPHTGIHPEQHGGDKGALSYGPDQQARREVNQTTLELRRMTLAELGRWITDTETVRLVTQTCNDLMASSKPSYKRSGVRLRLQLIRAWTAMAAELRLQCQSEQEDNKPESTGLTVEAAVLLLSRQHDQGE